MCCTFGRVLHCVFILKNKTIKHTAAQWIVLLSGLHFWYDTLLSGLHCSVDCTAQWIALYFWYDTLLSGLHFW